MIELQDDEIEYVGLDPKKVASIARRLSKAGQEARALGLCVFGGSGSGSLRAHHSSGLVVVATLDGDFDGGDGADYRGADGILRGE